MSQITFTLSRKQAAVLYRLLTTGAIHHHRAGDLSSQDQDHARRVMERIERRFAIHHFDPSA